MKPKQPIAISYRGALINSTFTISGKEAECWVALWNSLTCDHREYLDAWSMPRRIRKLKESGYMVVPVKLVHLKAKVTTRKSHYVDTHCPECKMLSIFGAQPHLDGCSRPTPIPDAPRKKLRR